MSKSIILPGDKSISHRVAMLAALADNSCSINNYNTGADCASTLQCLKDLGTEVGNSLAIRPHSFKVPKQPLNCGNSGSTIRMLTGLLAGQQIPAELTGDASLLKRPMARIAEPLREMGAVIQLAEGERAPIQLIEGSKHGIEYTLPISSAQVKTAILFAGLRFENTRVIEPVPSRDHTERLFHHLQIEPGPSVRIPSFSYFVPGDPSSAAFLIVAALIQNKELVLKNILLNPFRVAFLKILQDAGARVQVLDERIQQNEKVGEIQVQPGRFTQPIVITAAEVSTLIDEIPVLTIAGLSAGFEVHGAKELRFKESDRIKAMTSNLNALGAEVEEWEDGYRVKPGILNPGTAKTFGDHRIAMAFASAGIRIDDARCVEISFPEFFDLLKMM
ncbi:MAG TPA: 3-phosphoshikimate 1-carboxyvinyltransferase [Acidobacteriota bacterium]|nr:3-phosphoshikimate 1-carboxyvinyltransferase [Acidobacteriota bacterium]